MKKIIILLFVMLICNSMMSQGKIRTIILADTRDPKLSCGIQTNLSVTLAFTCEIAACLNKVDDYVEPIVLSGYQCTKDELRKQLASFNCADDDIVLFFYFGHGARGPRDKSIFPQMELHDAQRNLYDENLVPIEDVKDVLLAKNPRFLLVMGDCCNSEFNTITPKTNSLAYEADARSEYDPRLKYALKRLFLESKGFVITTGSTAGESGWYCISKDRNNDCNYENSHGYFTMIFWSTIGNCMDNNITWEKMMKEISDNTYRFTKQRQDQDVTHKMKSQRPIYEIGENKQREQMPQTNQYKPEQPKQDKPEQLKQDKPEQPKQDRPISDDTPLLSALVAVASDRNTDAYREKQAERVMHQYFSVNARVEIVARNGHTIVESESVQQFFDRISIAERLRNFSIHQKETDSNGKITYLLVHEIYEKE